MEFRKHQAIFLQIGENICEQILNATWGAGDKIPSVREMAVSVQVNPNTVMRTYADLQQKEIIYNRRGIGFFVADDAIEKIIALKRHTFLNDDLPQFFRTMQMLGIDMKEIDALYQRYLEKELENEKK